MHFCTIKLCYFEFYEFPAFFVFSDRKVVYDVVINTISLIVRENWLAGWWLVCWLVLLVQRSKRDMLRQTRVEPRTCSSATQNHSATGVKKKSILTNKLISYFFLFIFLYIFLVFIFCTYLLYSLYSYFPDSYLYIKLFCHVRSSLEN